MPSDPPRTQRGKAQREPASAESQSEIDGGLLKPALVFIVGTVVGWGAYLFAALVVLSYPTNIDAVSVTGLSSSTTFWIAVGLLVIIVFALLVRPGTVFSGWILMAGVVAVAATSGGGWTDGMILIEGLTLGFVGLAAAVKIIMMLPDWVIFAHALNRK